MRIALALALVATLAGCSSCKKHAPVPPPSDLRTLAASAGLARAADRLVELARPSIRLRTTPGPGRLGASRIGGTPDLPSSLPWPEHDGLPLAFLAQIQLADLPALDPEGALPHRGLLYFFYDAKEQPWGFDPNDRGSWHVLFHDGDPAQLHPTPPPPKLSDEVRFHPRALAAERELTVPPYESDDLRALHFDEHESDAYEKLQDRLAHHEGETPIHRLLGHPDPIQGEMQLACQLASNGINVGDSAGYEDPRARALEGGAAEWRLLFQLDSDGNDMMWGDVGRLYFWIRTSDLAARRFEKVWLQLQCG